MLLLLLGSHLGAALVTSVLLCLDLLVLWLWVLRVLLLLILRHLHLSELRAHQLCLVCMLIRYPLLLLLVLLLLLL